MSVFPKPGLSVFFCREKTPVHGKENPGSLPIKHRHVGESHLLATKSTGSKDPVRLVDRRKLTANKTTADDASLSPANITGEYIIAPVGADNPAVEEIHHQLVARKEKPMPKAKPIASDSKKPGTPVLPNGAVRRNGEALANGQDADCGHAASSPVRFSPLPVPASGRTKKRTTGLPCTIATRPPMTKVRTKSSAKFFQIRVSPSASGSCSSENCAMARRPRR